MDTKELEARIESLAKVDSAMVDEFAGKVLDMVKGNTTSASVFVALGSRIHDGRQTFSAGTAEDVAAQIADVLANHLAIVEAIWRLVGQAQILPISGNLGYETLQVKAFFGSPPKRSESEPVFRVPPVPVSLTLAPSLRLAPR